MKKSRIVVLLLAILAMGVPTFAQGPNLQPVPDDVLEAIVAAKDDANVYLVRLVEDPVIAYEGDIAGLPATKPAKGEKIDPHSKKVVDYVAYLDARHAAVLNAVGAKDNKIYSYRYSVNGFSALLTPAQAAVIAAMPGVTAVESDTWRQVTTDNSPTFLGLNAAGGLWDQLGGVENAGEDIIVGVIDTGIWPEHPSFSDQFDFADRPGESGKDTRVYGPPPDDWYGTCQSGEQWSQDDCNYKLIGARYYLDGFGHHGIVTHDYKSARDADGHGSHTSSTAAGNYGVPASIMGGDLGTVSGMAPRARIAMYKACWNDAGCFTSDLTAAIDQAVADGVDVINYSIGSDTPGLLGTDDIAFLFAADAGVYVATSAGNAGPGYGTVGSPASVPWVTAVGASTQNRTFLGAATLGNSATYYGASVTGGTGVLPLVDSEDAGSELCIPGELDSGVVAGKIVLCQRGVIARVDKSYAVYLAGGAGMIQYNTNDAQTENTDNHWVPSVHINNTNGVAIKAYIDAEGANATAYITGGTFTAIPAPWMAAFSSRGPDGAAEDIIKPDVTAPGVNILAANSPTPFIGATDQLFQAIGGTSMASPHVAGAGALLCQLHPDWTPAMIKSALMTTAYTAGVYKEDGVMPADPFDVGGGHIAPNPATDPGLVYDAGLYEYFGFLCGSTNAVSPATCDYLASLGIPFDASDLNLASIGIAELAGFQTIVRTVTNVGPAATYNVTYDAPTGIGVAVTPNTLTLANGESATYYVTFTTLSSATLNAWTFGSLTWSDGTHNVRSPIAIRPVPLSAPGGVYGAGTEGSLDFDITFGYSGDYTAGAHGLVPADMQAGNVLDDPANDWDTAFGCFLDSGMTDPACGITLHYVNVPAGSLYARFSLLDDYTDGADDLDLYVYDPDGYFAGGSGSGTSAEEVNVPSPMPGNYYVFVHGWQTDGTDANYTLFGWAFGPDAGNMTITAPAAATLGATETITVDWTGLTAGTKYLGAVSHSDAGGILALTLVQIDTD
jgi:hypothetical protein